MMDVQLDIPGGLPTSATGQRVEGLEALGHRFVVALLTARGSCATDPRAGTQLGAMLRSGLADPASLLTAATLSVQEAVRWMVRAQAQSTFPPAERLASAHVVSAEFDGQGRLRLRVTVRNAQGQAAALDLGGRT